MKGTKLSVTLHIGGCQVESLTPEQSERLAKRLCETMSIYYTAHTEEYQKIKTKKV